ncbi:MAG: hypothetical protein WAW86_06570, partial [Gammaproteobacteria bacterium]
PGFRFAPSRLYNTFYLLSELYLSAERSKRLLDVVLGAKNQNRIISQGYFSSPLCEYNHSHFSTSWRKL